MGWIQLDVIFVGALRLSNAPAPSTAKKKPATQRHDFSDSKSVISVILRDFDVILA
jgi:hypothetical protein